MNTASLFDFTAGEVLLVNKPIGWTSFDVVNKLRYSIKTLLGIKKIKIGHAGTLDPLATGLLIICTGGRTKDIDQFQNLDKEYSGIIRLGATTPSYDLETPISRTFGYGHISEKDILEAMSTLTGHIQQVPPPYSAIKIDGRRAYEYARKNNDVTIRPRQVTIHSFELSGCHLPDISFKVHCSKGTYIRSLANDLGTLLACGGHLVKLCREQIGSFNLQSAYELDDLLASIAGQA